MKTFSVKVDRLENFVFKVDFGLEGVADLVMDEPEPVGEGKGPNASNIIAAAMGNCLSASLLFCLNKSHVEVNDIQASVDGAIKRNEEGRWRISKIEVNIDIDIEAGYENQIKRCLDIFEEYCIASQSIKDGIPVEVEVEWS